MKVTHTYEITDAIIKQVVDELNDLEYNGLLTVEKIKKNKAAFNYIFSKSNIRDIFDGNLYEAWNSDCFSALQDMIPA